ncbi:diablo homolog, mitochondrial-like isoform X1 [Polypterus senegalus]|uniref:diablo homolog, mitochondrial-like isoform X1 n=1 Tax=Polypterus senegalus TaxID=55291 RepID=UPI001963B0B0|nr:diablo homolog, mitochondrial-like isoform X1 [Polypterus senegalus]
MAARRVCMLASSILRYSVGVPRCSRQRLLIRIPCFLQRHWHSVSLGAGLCAIPFVPKSDSLTHEALIKRAASLVTDSSNTYLSQTSLALIEALTEYTKAVYTLISLQKRYINMIGKMNPKEENEIWQVIISLRVEVKEKKETCSRFDSNWMTAVNLSEIAAEAAYGAGADQASISARTQLQTVQNQMEEVKQLAIKAEKMLAEVQAEEIRRVSEHALQVKNSGKPADTNSVGEEEIPEAYLRED